MFEHGDDVSDLKAGQHLVVLRSEIVREVEPGQDK